uniref:Dual specificity protein phosphatase n=2 Tax=Hippocampus comes TaxID=109280 RepID=A0A3Q2XI52_HIPCM
MHGRFFRQKRLSIHGRFSRLKMPYLTAVPEKFIHFTFCRNMASDRRELARVGITHIVNCAQSRWRGAADCYAGMNVTYLGIEAHDSPAFDMSKNFYPAAEFIHKALTGGGKVLVHCAVGLSRSATLVLAYLMIRQNLTLVEAIKTVKDHRGVTPNRGFLRQLSGLDGILRESRRAAAAQTG